MQLIICALLVFYCFALLEGSVDSAKLTLIKSEETNYAIDQEWDKESQRNLVATFAQLFCDFTAKLPEGYARVTYVPWASLQDGFPTRLHVPVRRQEKEKISIVFAPSSEEPGDELYTGIMFGPPTQSILKDYEGVALGNLREHELFLQIHTMVFTDMQGHNLFPFIHDLEEHAPYPLEVYVGGYFHSRKLAYDTFRRFVTYDLTKEHVCFLKFEGTDFRLEGKKFPLLDRLQGNMTMNLRNRTRKYTSKWNWENCSRAQAPLQMYEHGNGFDIELTADQGTDVCIVRTTESLNAGQYPLLFFALGVYSEKAIPAQSITVLTIFTGTRKDNTSRLLAQHAYSDEQNLEYSPHDQIYKGVFSFVFMVPREATNMLVQLALSSGPKITLRDPIFALVSTDESIMLKQRQLNPTPPKRSSSKKTSTSTASSTKSQQKKSKHKATFPTTPVHSSDSKSGFLVKVILIIAALVVIALIALCCFFKCRSKRKQIVQPPIALQPMVPSYPQAQSQPPYVSALPPNPNQLDYFSHF